MLSSSLHQIIPGLLSAAAFNALTTDEAHRHKQLHTLGKPLLGGLSAFQAAQHSPPLVPATYEPAGDAQGWQYNVQRFLALLATDLRSGNAYNDHTPLAHAAILAQGWLEVPPTRQLLVAPGRNRLDNISLVGRFVVVLETCGFNKNTPVLFNRQGHILDGYHRLLACQQTGNKAYFIQLDY